MAAKVTPLSKSDVAEMKTLFADCETEGPKLLAKVQAHAAKAFRLGELLAQQKASLKHGEWIPWVEKHLGGTVRKAQQYIRIAKNRELLESKYETVSHLPIAGSLKLLSKPKETVVEQLNRMYREDVAETRQLVEDFIEHGKHLTQAKRDGTLAEVAKECGYDDDMVQELLRVYKDRKRLRARSDEEVSDASINWVMACVGMNHED